MNAKHTVTLLALVAVSAHAQVVRVVPEEFPVQATPASLPIKPLKKPAAAAQDRAQDNKGEIQVVTEVREQFWNIKSGETIRSAVQEWAQRAGWHLVWQLEDREDFRFLAGNRFSGDFKSAVYGLFNSLPLDVKVRAELRPDNTPPMVLITRDEGIR